MLERERKRKGERGKIGGEREKGEVRNFYPGKELKRQCHDIFQGECFSFHKIASHSPLRSFLRKFMF